MLVLLFEIVGIWKFITEEYMWMKAFRVNKGPKSKGYWKDNFNIINLSIILKSRIKCWIVTLNLWGEKRNTGFCSSLKVLPFSCTNWRCTSWLPKKHATFYWLATEQNATKRSRPRRQFTGFLAQILARHSQ